MQNMWVRTNKYKQTHSENMDMDVYQRLLLDSIKGRPNMNVETTRVSPHLCFCNCIISDNYNTESFPITFLESLYGGEPP